MSDTVEINVDDLARLIEGARHLYHPAFPDEDNRAAISHAVNRAEEKVES